MQDQSAAAGSGVSYYRGRFRAAMAWSKVSRERAVEATVLPGKKHDSEISGGHSTKMPSETLRHSANLDGRQSSLTTAQ